MGGKNTEKAGILKFSVTRKPHGLWTKTKGSAWPKPKLRSFKRKLKLSSFPPKQDSGFLSSRAVASTSVLSVRLHGVS